MKRQVEVLREPFSWWMPDAEFADNATIKAFLRGPDVSMKPTKGKGKFKGFQEARNYAAKWMREKQVNASFEKEARSTDGNVAVTITKTRKWFVECQQKLQQYKTELKSLMEIDRGIDGNAKERARLE